MNMQINSASASASRVEWELLPSLLNLLSPRRPRSQPAWMETVPSELDVVMPSGPFEERLPGLSVREVREPDIFQIFFG
jgi:hypothetical protein